jgi:hypothetical protein
MTTVQRRTAIIGLMLIWTFILLGSMTPPMVCSMESVSPDDSSSVKSSPYFRIVKDRDDPSRERIKTVKKPAVPVKTITEKPHSKPILTTDDIAPGADMMTAEICERVEDRNPVGSGESFTSSIPSVSCYTVIKSAHDLDIRHIWYFNNRQVLNVPLRISASDTGWRVFSTKSLSPSFKGPWKVDIQTENGTLLKSLSFIVN